MERGKRRVRGDIVHERLVALGCTGSERSTPARGGGGEEASPARPAARLWPWVHEPGMWFQYDFGDGW